MGVLHLCTVSDIGRRNLPSFEIPRLDLCLFGDFLFVCLFVFYLFCFV